MERIEIKRIDEKQTRICFYEDDSSKHNRHILTHPSVNFEGWLSFCVSAIDKKIIDLKVQKKLEEAESDGRKSK